MKVTITFETNNAAFGDNGINEYGYIMTQAYERADTDQKPGTFPLMDSNGNKVGTVTVRK